MSDAPPPPARRRLGPGRLVAFTALVLVLFLGLLEGALHILAASQGPQRHASADDLPAPDPAAFRVVAVGDSWVYGAESEPHEAFIEVFARAASAELGRPVQVVNLGQSASNSSQALVALSRSIDVIEPDLVVALTGANNLLHDKGVAEAARIMGEDARMVPGLSALSGLRTVRLARILQVSLTAPPAPEETPESTSPPVTQVVRLPWWDLYVSRRWSDALTVLSNAALPSQDARMLGVKTAWEALLRAQLGEEQATSLAERALDGDGDDATAFEALAVVAEFQGRPLAALHHRAQAARASGHPWIRERARGLVLLEIEALEEARDQLLSVQRATPGELQTLQALSRLPQAVRTPEVDALLFDGPRGLVTPEEYFAYHLQSSGLVDRAADALGDADPDESVARRLTRARARELQGDPQDALARYTALVDEAEAKADQDRARAGVLRLATSAQVVDLLGSGPADLLDASPGPATALALMERADADGDCVVAQHAAVAAIDAGALPHQLERRIGPCIPAALVWSILDMGLDRDAQIRAPRLLGGAEPAPKNPAWDAVLARAPSLLPLDADGGDRALALALAGDLDGALAVEAGDPALRSLAAGLVRRALGDEDGALADFARAAEAADTTSAWARAVARGFGEAAAQRWGTAQDHLLPALAASPGQLEILGVLRSIPDAHRRPATERVLGSSPAGRIRVDQWVDWFLDGGQTRAAELALRWSWAAPETSADRARRSLAEARIHAARGDAEAAARARNAAQASADATESPLLKCLTRSACAGVLPDDRPTPPLAAAWIRERTNPVAPPPSTPSGDDLLVRQLDAMHRLSTRSGARFVALTYPFPSGHHAQVRDQILQAADLRGVPVLDLHAAFAQRYTAEQWRALRTPEDHVNAEGYALMGQLLHAWLQQREQP